MKQSFCSCFLAQAFLLVAAGAAFAGDGNRLTYLDDPFNPYYVGRNFPKLTTPQWVGEEGVEALVVLAIDDMRGHEKWEAYLRPILDRLKQIDGRAPVSIMTNTIDPQDPHLQQWLKEGLSLETHTIDHPCPLLKDGDFVKAKSTYDRCVDLLASVPNNKPVAFRMPCCDSLNTVSPRFFAEIFNKTTDKNNFLQIDSSVFNLITPNDPDLPRELVFDSNGNDRFRKYIPADRTFVNTIEDYPYPYVIGGLCWEFPCVVPSDWSAQHLHKPNNPITVEDWKAALDAVVIKQGVFNLVFHPHGWIKAEQIVELIDYAVAKHGTRVKFLTFREAIDRLKRNMQGGMSLREQVAKQGMPVRRQVPSALPAGISAVDPEGRDAGLRFVDVNGDGHDDIIFSNADRYAVYLFDSKESGWSRALIAGKRGDRSAQYEIPPIVRADGTNNGFWVHSRHLFWQNEETAKLRDLVDRRSFDELLVNEMPLAKTPEESLRAIRTRPGLGVELVAAEPLVMDPIAFAWGPDGKFWVVEMGDYPLGTDGKGKHGGRVRFLEDVDGDGRYDKSTVFLDELGFPTGVMPWRKGVLVTCAPEIFYAEDTDGDGKADKRVVLFSGFAQGNQQHRVNGLVWGLDNWIYGANGDSGGGITVVGSLREPDAPRSRSERSTVNISGRDFRIRPDEGLIDAVTGQTQFGRSRDDWGNWFGCNNSNPMYQFVLPDHYIRRNPHVPAPDPRVNVSAVPGASPVFPISRTLERFNDPNTANRFTSACSAIVYRDDLLGPEFEGNSFVSEPVHNLIHREVMSPRGVRITSRRAADEQTSEFLASTDNWFRPTMIQTGPDGALWIADMYRLVIEHPEWIPKEWQERLDLRAGHDKGRIYRVIPVGKKPRPIPRMDKLDTAGLVAALDSPSGWQRDMAHMMLLWRGDKSAGPALMRLVETCERPAARVQALSALDGLGLLREPILLRALRDSHSGVRRRAVRLAESRLAQFPAVAEAVLRLADDPDAPVRMQVAFSLGEWDDARAGRALGQIALRDSADPFIIAALASSATRNAAEIVAVVTSRRGPAPESNAGQASELVERLIGQMVAQGDDAALGRSLAAITELPKGSKPEPWQLGAVAGVLDSLDRRGKSLTDLSRSSDGDLKSALERVAKLIQSAGRVAADQSAAPADRVAAVRLVGRGPDSSAADAELLAGLLEPQTPGELQEAAVAAAVRLRNPRVPDRLLDGWPSHGPRVRGAVLDALLSRDPWWITLLDRVEAGKVPAGEIGAVYRQRMLDHKSSVVRDRAAKLFGRPSEELRQKIMGDYAGVAKLSGDRARGSAVFQKTCSPCHRVGAVGHEIGPNLSAMANRSTEFFLASILDPNRAVETRYLSYLAATRDGRVFTGMLAAETGNSVTLVAQEGKRETLLRTEIESLKSSGKSLMPDGMERDIPPLAMADLLAFLHSAGPPRKTFAGNQPELVKPELLRHELYLLATTSEIYGSTLVFEDKYKNLGYWSSENDHAVWNFEVDRPGKYSVILDYACDDSTAGKSFVLEVGEAQLTGPVPGTGNWDTYKQLRIGTLTLAAGPHRLLVRSAGRINGPMIDLRGIRITPFKGP